MIDLTVKTLDSQNHVFSLEDDQITVRGFKEYIAESVAVPADSQRLIYCGRVLQDEKKLNDYDVNGKVIHLVQRAPPQPGQHGNDGGQTQGQTQNRQGWQNSQRPHYRVTRTQMHGNAMYLGAMSVPAEIVEGHGIPQLSNSLSGSRLNHAGRMLDQINELIDRLDDPSAPPLHPPSEVNQSAAQHQQQNQQQQQQQQNQQESEIEQNEDDSARLAEAAAAAITAALSAAGARAVTLFRGSSYNSGSTRASSDANEHQNDVQSSQSQSHSQSQSQPQQQSQTQSQQQQQQQQQQQTQGTADTGATSSNAGQNRRAQQQDLPRPPQMAELLQRLCNTQDRLRPYLERYCMLTLLDPSFESGPNIVEESQRIIDGVSEILHLMSHCCHALSDIIIDMSQPPPRNLRCRPIIIQHSAILQPSIPIQVEAHISLNGRSANNNNTNEETAESGNQAQSDNTESSTSSRINTEDGNEERESDNAMQSQERPQDQGSSPFDSVFNLPNNVEVLMEVSSESNIDAGSNNEQNASGNENNNNARRTNVFPFGTPPPPHFMRNFMQAVAGHMVHGGITTTTISTRNPPVITVGTQQGTSSSMDNGSTNAGQSTQARSNTGTHPTTATQTRSTSRPHVFHHHAHPMGLGMSIGLGLDFDPYLPCNSHHVYRSPNSTFNTGTGMTTSSQATRTTSTTTADAQNQTNQAATTLTTTTSTTSTSTTSATNAETTTNNSFANFLQQLLNQSAGGQLQSNINITPNLMENIGNIMQVLGNNIHVGFLSDNSMGNAPTLADLLEVGGLSMAAFPPHESGEGNFLVDLLVLLAQSMSLDGLIRVRLGWEAIARVRRPLQEFLQYTFSSASSPEAIQEQAIERLLSQLRPHIQNLLASEEDTSAARSGSRGSRVDICATIESLITRHARDILRILFDSGINDAKFGQDILNILINMCSQICIVLRYSLRGGLEAIVTRFMRNLMDGGNPVFLRWIMNGLIAHLRTYFLSTQFPESIMQLLIYRDTASQPSSVSSTSTRQPTQAQSEDVPMETETLEQQPQEQQQQSMRESSISEDREEIPETFPGHEALPSDWVPIIARDGVRQRRQLQMQGVAPNGGMAFSDAYLGSLPSKRRKLIEQQKPRLLVSPTPNHSAIAASIERLVREGIDRAGVEMDEGVVGDPAADVAADPAVRRAFGQAIRDCLNPCRYSTPDFPDPLRFPNATKYFANQERPPK